MTTTYTALWNKFAPQPTAGLPFILTLAVLPCFLLGDNSVHGLEQQHENLFFFKKKGGRGRHIPKWNVFHS